MAGWVLASRGILVLYRFGLDNDEVEVIEKLDGLRPSLGYRRVVGRQKSLGKSDERS